MVGRGSDLYQLCKDIDDTIKGAINARICSLVWFLCLLDHRILKSCVCLCLCVCLASIYKNGQLVEHSDCKPWVEDSYWEIKRSNNAIVEEAYKQFNGKTFYEAGLPLRVVGVQQPQFCLAELTEWTSLVFFLDVLHECRLLNNRATHIISQTERSMSLKKQPKQFAIWVGTLWMIHCATFSRALYDKIVANEL